MAEIAQIRQVISHRVSRKQKELPDKVIATESSPIGMFDSGVGGLTVFEAVTKLMPHESVIYLADTARVPYGGRSAADIININKEIIPYLISLGSKIVIMACGTSSSLAYPVLKDKYKVPIIGMIEGGARMAVAATKNKKIGVIGTVGTINSGSYQNAIKALDKAAVVSAVPCPLLVPLIEGGFAMSDETTKVLKEYLKPLIAAKIDTLVLGCTHYPHLRPALASILSAGVTLIDPAQEAAIAARDVLRKLKMLAPGNEAPKHRFLVTAAASNFKDLGSRLLARPLSNVEEISVVKPR